MRTIGKPVAIYVLAFCLLLSGCAPGQLFGPTPTPTPAPPTNVNGDWKGSGTTSDGKEITLDFTVENNMISYIQIGWLGTTGELCAHLGASTGLLAAPQLPIEIIDYTFSEDAFGVTGTFKSNTLASGIISFTDDDTSSRPDCNGTFEAKWEGVKK